MGTPMLSKTDLFIDFIHLNPIFLQCHSWPYILKVGQTDSVFALLHKDGPIMLYAVKYIFKI